MTGPERPDRDRAAARQARWGFCGTCELWRLSDGWGDPPACPECGARPAPLERWAGGAYRLELALDLPPGTDLPLLG
jgi:hypothetical protein